MIEKITNIDFQIFNYINSYATHPVLDSILIPVRNMYFWSPLYLFIAVFFIVNYGKKGAWVVLGLMVCFAFSDVLASLLIKPWVARPRPCHTPDLFPDFRLLVRCGSGFSFPSAHATNHFAVSFYLMPFFHKFGTLPKILLFVWAATVAYAQVYVGVHYPVDVLTGAFLGAGIGVGISLFFKKTTHWDT